MLSGITIYVFGVGGAVLCALGWRGKRCGQERRCRHCGYDLTGNVAGRCSECGREFTDETVVIGTRRRRWGVAATGLLSLGIGACFLADAVGSLNLRCICPSYGLLVLAKLGDADSLAELDTRVSAGKLSHDILRATAAAALDRQSVQWEEFRDRQAWIDLLETLDIGGHLTDAEQERYYGQVIAVDEPAVDKAATIGDEWKCRLDMSIQGPNVGMFSEVKVVDVMVGGAHYREPDHYITYNKTFGVSYGQFVLTTKVDQEPGVYPATVSLEVELFRGSRMIWSQSVTYTGEIEIRLPDPFSPIALKINELLRRVPPACQEEQWDEARRVRAVTNADYAALAEAARDVKLMDEQWRYALGRTGIIQMRERWPRGVPLTIGLIAPRWPAPCKIEALPRIPGWELLEWEWLGWKPLLAANFPFRDVFSEPQQTFQLTYGYPDEATSQVEFDCRVWRKGRRPWDEQPLRLAWEGTVALPITLVSTVDEVMEAVTDEQLTKPMKQFVDVRCTLQEGPAGDEARVLAMVLLDRTKSPELDGLALGLAADIVLEEEVLASATMTTIQLSMDGKIDCGISNQATLHAKGWRAGVKQETRLRFRSDAEAALRQLDCSKYWSGEFEVKLEDVLK